MDNPITRILIIEDNPDDGELLMRQLKKANLGEQIKVIDDGRLALDFLKSAEAEQLVAVFLDLKLPSLHGVLLLEKLRSHDRMRHLPVIVMTSSNSPDDLNKCKALGVSSYVQKPVTFAAFSKAVADTFHSTNGWGAIRTQEL
jgi:CheY-like chemotaxis protein